MAILEGRRGECHPVRSEKAFAVVLGRLARAFGQEGEDGLAACLECPPEEMTQARVGLYVPGAWFLVAFLKTGADPAWLLTGESGRKPERAASRKVRGQARELA